MLSKLYHKLKLRVNHVFQVLVEIMHCLFAGEALSVLCCSNWPPAPSLSAPLSLVVTMLKVQLLLHLI